MKGRGRPVESQFGARGNYAHGAPVPLFPLQAASPPNQTSFVVSGLSENTQVYTAGLRLQTPAAGVGSRSPGSLGLGPESAWVSPLKGILRLRASSLLLDCTLSHVLHGFSRCIQFLSVICYLKCVLSSCRFVACTLLYIFYWKNLEFLSSHHYVHTHCVTQ